MNMPYPDRWLRMPAIRMRVALAVSVVATALIIRLVYLKHLHPERRDPKLDVAFLGFVALMCLCAGSRGGAVIDRQGRRLIRWWGPLFPVWKHPIDFGAIQRVAVGAGPKPGYPQTGPRNHWSWHVAVQTAQGPVVVRWTKSFEEATALAQCIADAVGCERQTCAVDGA